MKILFRLALLVFTIYSYGQKHVVLNKVFETNSKTTSVLNFTKTHVSIEPSFDGKMHFYYTVDFENFTKEDQEKAIETLQVTLTEFENNIHLESSSITNAQTKFILKGDDALIIEDDLFGNKKQFTSSFKSKSKDSIVKLIANSKNELSNFMKMLKTVDDSGNKKALDTKNMTIQRSDFVIKIPSHVRLNILAKDSNITIVEAMENELKITAVGGTFKAKHMANEFNDIEVSDGTILIETIKGGDYELKNVRNGLIAGIENATITTEFSKIEFGEIRSKVTLNDFNGDLWFHNFSSDFKRFNLNAEYSKINLFYPKDDYSLDTYGHNTVHYLGDNKITMQPNKEGKKYKMMQKKPSEKGHFSGALNFDIVHSIMRSNDSILTINKD